MGLFDLFKKKKPEVTVSFTEHDYSPAELNQQREQEVNDIRKLANKSHPSKNGLRPHEIAMLASAHKYQTSGNHFPRYWYFDYAIDDPQYVLNMLADRGFIRVASAKESIEHLKVPELKEILSSFDLSAKGKKADLISVICANISEQDLAEKIPIRHFALTELGEQELKENEYVMYFGGTARYGLTVWDMNELIQSYPAKLFRDCIWRRFNELEQTAIEHLSMSGDFYPYYRHRITLCLQQSDFLVEEKRQPGTALNFLTESFYYKLKIETAALCVGRFKLIGREEKYEAEPRMKRVRDRDTGKNILVQDDYTSSFYDMLSPSFYASRFKAMKEALDLSDDELRHMLIDHFDALTIDYARIRTVNIPKLTISNEEIAAIIIAEINGDQTTADTICRRVDEQIKKTVYPRQR